MKRGREKRETEDQMWGTRKDSRVDKEKEFRTGWDDKEGGR